MEYIPVLQSSWLNGWGLLLAYALTLLGIFAFGMGTVIRALVRFAHIILVGRWACPRRSGRGVAVSRQVEPVEILSKERRGAFGASGEHEGFPDCGIWSNYTANWLFIEKNYGL